MLRLFTLLFGISLFVLLGSITITRQSESSAYWLLTRHSTHQLRSYDYVLSLPDGRASRIIASPSNTNNVNWFIDWLPDNNTILYLDEDIYTMDVRSGAVRRIIETTDTVIGFDTLLSPSGDWTLLELRNSSNTQLFRMGTSGNQVQLIDEVPSVSSNMSWSSNGDTIYFVNFANNHYLPFASDGHSITEVPWGQRFEQFSPDGTQKAFYDEDNQNVWRIEDTKTGKITPLTPLPDPYYLLDWLPNNWILLEKIADRTNPDYDHTHHFYRIRPDGSNHLPLFTTNPAFSNQTAPFWTDDWFYVNSSKGENEALYRINIETGMSQVVIDDFLPFTLDEVVDLYDGTARIVRLIGDWIIWRTLDMQFMRSRLDGSETMPVYNVPDGAKTPQLYASPDNQWLYVTFFDRSGAWSVDRINLNNRDVEIVFRGNQNLLTVSPAVDFKLRPYLLALAILVILTMTFVVFIK